MRPVHDQMPLPPNLTRIHAQLLLSRALVATSFTVGAAITHGLPPEMLTLLRFMLATVLFAPYVWYRHRIAWPTLRALGGYAAISASIVTFFWCMFEALRHTSALNCAAIHTLVPSMAALYALGLVGERVGIHRWLALAVGLVGALWVVFRGEPERVLSMEVGKGDLIFFLGCLAMALYAPLVKRFHRNEPTAVMTLWVLITGVGWLLLINLSVLPSIEWTGVSLKVFAGILYLAVFTTIATFLIQQHAAVHLGPTRVASYNYLTPALVVGADWLSGHAFPSLGTLVGVAIILAATLVVQSGARRTSAG